MLDNHPQWDIPDTEEEDEEQEDSDGIEESEDDDEDNDWMRTHARTHTHTRSNIPFSQSVCPPTHSWPRSNDTTSATHRHTHRITGDELCTRRPALLPFPPNDNTNCDPSPSVAPFLQRLDRFLSIACGKEICEYLYRPAWMRESVCAYAVCL